MKPNIYSILRRIPLPLLLTLMLLAALPLSARDFSYTYAGQPITYTVIDETAKTCKTKEGRYSKYYYPGNYVNGPLVLPEHPMDGETEYTLIEISDYSFCDCIINIKENNLSSVYIPNSVTKIGNFAFFNHLELTSVILGNAVTTIGNSAFSACEKLNSINIPKSVIKIGEDAFKSTPLKKAEFESIESICSIDFYNQYSNPLALAKNLYIQDQLATDIIIPTTITKIGNYAFVNCSSLNSITIPNSITSIGKSAFSGCSGLTSVTIPNSVTSIYSDAFSGCTLTPLRLNCYVGHSITVSSGSVIECLFADLNSINTNSGVTKSAWNQYKYDLEPFCLGARIIPTENKDFDPSIVFTKTEVVISGYNEEAITTIIDNTKTNIVKGQNPGKSYNYNINSYTADGTKYRIQAGEFRTRDTYPIYYALSSTQTSVRVSGIIYEVDPTVEVAEIGFILGPYDEYKEYKGKDLVFEDLKPAWTHYIVPVVKDKNGNTLNGTSLGINTRGWDFYANKTVGPTTAVLKASFTEKEAKADECWWEFDGQRVSNKNMTLLSLAPQREYKPKFYIKYKDTTYPPFEAAISTGALELTTLQPKGVSSTCAIVAATTNISDLEPMVGFQWKKYDAPASLAPSEGYGAICDGVLEGYLKNLQSTSYYNVRPFYKDAQNKYYYGDWVTFDPSDFSFFEPTVRTYPVEEVTQTSATVRGYALSGTENITSQGFQYWISGGSHHAPALAPAAEDIKTVTVKGQVMVVTFEDLEPGCTYTYRAFVETESGFTYGDEQTFTTEAVDGVGYVQAEEVTVVGYYTLTGLRSDKPHQGLNIVVYSNGKTRKMIMK